MKNIPASLLFILMVLPIPAFASVPDAIPVSDRVCLFLDDRFIAEQQGLQRVWHQGQPQASIVEPTEPWEPINNTGGLHMYGSVVFDPQDHTYKMYYQAWGGKIPHSYAACLATSSDGKTWIKPKLGFVEMLGNRDNNVLIAGAAHPNVFLDPFETDPAKRFKMFVWGENGSFEEKVLNGLCLFTSGDGIHWRLVGQHPYPQPADDTLEAGTALDAYHFLPDPLGGRYMGTFRLFPSHPGLPGFFRDAKSKMSYGIGGHRRAVGVSWSKQLGVPWPPQIEVLRADAIDDRLATQHSQDSNKLDYAELYVLPAFNYGNHYIGWLSILATVDELQKGSKEGTGDLQLAFSHDGRTWHRQPDRTSAIARGEDKKLFATYAMGNEPLDLGNEMWVYYTEANGAHPVAPKFISRLRAAAWRKDGFVSMDCPGKGTLTTPPLAFEGTGLRVNFSGESLRVALLDESGKTIVESEPVQGDSVAHQIKWKRSTDLSALQGKSARLKFEIVKGQLWSFRFAK